MRKREILAGLLVLAILAAGCTGAGGAATTATPKEEEAVPVVAVGEDAVIAEALIEPARWSELHFEVAGEVAEVLAETGDRVTAGAPLLHLDTDELELSLQSAQQDIVAQKAALDGLVKGASDRVVARADKENADRVAQAEVVLQVKELQLEKAHADDPAADVAAAQARVEQLQLQLAQMQVESAEADVAIAQGAVDSAQAELDQLLADPDEQTVEVARLNWDLARNSLWQAQLDRDATAGRSGVPGYQKDLADAAVDAAGISALIAQFEYELAAKGATDEAVRISQAALRQAQAQQDQALSAQEAHTIGLDILQAQIDEAEEQLARATAAQEAYAVTLEVLAAEVEAAQLDLEALRTWDNPYRDEATDEEIAQAKARLQQAELTVAQLELQLQDAELRAPFAGTVVDVLVETGDQVNPGQVVVVLATLDQLQARTVDLTELDVARVTVGQAATVSVDALPGREFAGVVDEIALQAKDYRGDVVYDVVVELTDPDLAETLRWGMTTMVEIQTR
jgi:HlyD family secretion protein